MPGFVEMQSSNSETVPVPRHLTVATRGAEENKGQWWPQDRQWSYVTAAVLQGLQVSKQFTIEQKGTESVCTLLPWEK